MPDTLVPRPGHIATTNMHIGAQLPVCEWARKVVDGQGNILGNYSQMILTTDDAFEDYYFSPSSYWQQLANHKLMLPLLATHFALSLGAKIRSSPGLGLDFDDDLHWGVAANLKYNATGESFWAGTAEFLAQLNDPYIGTRARFMFDALKEGVLTSGHMDEIWRIEIYLRCPANTKYYSYMRTWAHAFYGAYLPLK